MAEQIKGSELKDFFAHFPPKVSQELVGYARDVVFKWSRYLFIRREGKQQYGYCTHCHNEFKTDHLKHNDKFQCPKCGSTCTVKASGRGRKRMIDETYFVWYEKSVINPKAIIATGIYAVRDYRNDYHRVEIQFEPMTMYIFEPGNPRMIKRWAYYSETENHCLVGPWEKCRSVFSIFNHGHISYTQSIYSRESITAAVKDTPFRYSGWEHYDFEDMTSFFALSAKYPCIEYLTKLGMTFLVNTKLKGDATYRTVNWRGKNLFKVLRLTKKELNEIRAQGIQVTFEFLKIMQMSKKDKSNFTPWEAALIAQKNQYYIVELEKFQIYGNLRKNINYFAKQREKYPEQFYNAHSVLITWRDYIEDCIKLETLPDQANPFPKCTRLECPFHGCMGDRDNTCKLYNFSQESPGLIIEWASRIDYCNRPSRYSHITHVIYPRNLYQEHQNTIKQIKIKADEELNKKIVAMAIGRNKKYHFELNGLLIRPAATVNELIEEGEMLNHCVGGYAARYARGETDILFVRKMSDPDKPYFTVEISKNEIRQIRGKNNCNPNDEVKTFIEAFAEQKLKQKKNSRAKVAVPA